MVSMYDSIISLATANGIWALLFVFLFLYELKYSKSREIKYQNTIDKLTEQLSVVYDVKDTVEEIKENEEIFTKRFLAKSKIETR